MLGLTLDQVRFLIEQDIPLERVFDATGMSRSTYSVLMKEDDRTIAFGVSPCYQGHALRTRHGHCVQCDTARIAFATRGSAAGEVYAAYSEATGLSKIGCANDAEARLATLRKTGYGGAHDWFVMHVVQAERMGRVEAHAHRVLSEHRTTRWYERGGHSVCCYELYDCLPTDAMEAVDIGLGLANDDFNAYL